MKDRTLSLTRISIASWNVNGLRSLVRSGGFAHLVDLAEIVCLQESRMSAAQFSELNLGRLFGAHAPSAIIGRAGVVTLSTTPPVSTSVDPLGDKVAAGRALLTSFSGLSVLNVYAPHGGRDRSRINEKLRFFEALTEWVTRWQGGPLVVTGDLNVARSDLDLARPGSNRKNTMFSRVEIEAVERLLDAGLCDVFRDMHPTARRYTWWPYAYDARARNVGWRIDYVLVSPDLLSSVGESVILDGVLGSDHCPVAVTMNRQMKDEPGWRTTV